MVVYYNSTMGKKIWKFNEIKELKKMLSGKRIVLAGGCFDLIHYGHFTFLKGARQEGDILIVALESDDFIHNAKSRKPIHTQMQRAEILVGLEFVDYVLLLPFFKSNEDYFELVKIICPDIVAITAGDKHADLKKKQAELIQATVKVVCTLLPEFSTTRILNL